MKSKKEGEKLIQTPINFRPDVRKFISDHGYDLQKFVRYAVDDRIERLKQSEQLKKSA